MYDDYMFYLSEDEEKEMLETLPDSREDNFILEF
jgi:hypothetical protein